MLRAGFASVDVTPDLRQPLMGYDFRWSELPLGNEGVHDALLARVLVLHDGVKPAALVSLELCVLEVDLARELRAAVAQKIGTTVDRVMISTIHTHSGPWPRLRGGGGEEADGEFRRLCEEYGDFLRARLLDAAARAAGLTYPVTARVQEAALGIGYVRRVRTEGGIEHCWNPLEFPELRPAGSPDPTCTALVLRQPHGPRAHVLWSAGAHPVVLGKTSRVVSADWPGAACRMIERTVPGAQAMFFLGACGEVHPWIATQEDAGQIEPVAAAAASMVRLLCASGAGLAEDSPTLRIATRTWACGKLELDLAVWRIGPALVVGAPVELFASLSRRIRERVKRPMIVATLANGWTGYWPDQAAFAEGKYEVNATWGIEAGDGERLVEELAGLAGEVGE